MDDKRIAMKCNIRGEHISRSFNFGSNHSSAYSCFVRCDCQAFFLKALVEELVRLRNARYTFLISNLRRALNVVFFLLGDTAGSEFSVPTFRDTLLHRH
jgi:hypothetical protein